MPKFKVGDRVVLAAKYYFATKGLIGTIIPIVVPELKVSSSIVLVAFDNWFEGHDGNSCGTPNPTIRNRYYVEVGYLALVSTEPETSMEGIEEI